MNTTNTYDNTLSNIGFKLETLRVKKGFSSSKAFADRYELPSIQYWKMEKGRANITLKSLMRVLAIHEMSMEDFFCMDLDKKAAA